MNDKKDKKVIIMIILSIIAVFSLISGVTVPTKSKRLASSGSDPIDSKRTFNLVEGLSLKRSTTRSSYNEWGRDPFTKGIAIRASSENILEGIIWDKQLPLALIRGKTVKIGDRIGSDWVIDIQKDKVILNDGTRDRELKL